MEFRVRIQDTATKKLEDIGKKLPSALMKGVNDSLIVVQAQAKRNVITGGKAGLHVRTGHLQRSIAYERPKIRGKKIVGKVGTDVVYGAVHEFGATIRPKRVKFLTIPLAAAKARSGAGRGRARDFPNTFVKKGIIFQKRGGKIIPLFALKKRVEIPKRPWLRPALEKSVGKIQAALTRRIKEVLQ